MHSHLHLEILCCPAAVHAHRYMHGNLESKTGLNLQLQQVLFQVLHGLLAVCNPLDPLLSALAP